MSVLTTPLDGEDNMHNWRDHSGSWPKYNAPPTHDYRSLMNTSTISMYEAEKRRAEVHERDRLNKRIRDLEAAQPKPDPITVVSEKVESFEVKRRWHGWTLELNVCQTMSEGRDQHTGRTACFHTKAALLKFLESDL